MPRLRLLSLVVTLAACGTSDPDSCPDDLADANEALVTCEAATEAAEAEAGECADDLEAADLALTETEDDLDAATALLTDTEAALETCETDAAAFEDLVAGLVPRDDAIWDLIAEQEGTAHRYGYQSPPYSYFQDDRYLLSNGVLLDDFFQATEIGAGSAMTAQTFEVDGADLVLENGSWRSLFLPDGTWALVSKTSTYLPRADQSLWVLDATDAETTGTWSTVVSDDTDYLNDYLEDDGTGGAATVTFAPPSFSAGNWYVVALTARRPDAATNASFQLGSNTPVSVDLSDAERRTLLFSQSPMALSNVASATVTVSAAGADGPVLVDAVVWIKAL